MATVPTNNPIPSEDPRDLKFNAGKIDEVVNSDANYYTDRFGVRRFTIAGFQYTAEEAIRNYGYITMDSFEDGATLTLPNQVLRYEATGEYYRWDGEFPKIVPAGSTPDSTGEVKLGAWVSVGDASLRTQLASITGTSHINHSGHKFQIASVYEYLSWKNGDISAFGGAYDNPLAATDNKSALEAMELKFGGVNLNLMGSSVYLPDASLATAIQVSSLNIWGGGTLYLGQSYNFALKEGGYINGENFVATKRDSSVTRAILSTVSDATKTYGAVNYSNFRTEGKVELFTVFGTVGLDPSTGGFGVDSVTMVNFHAESPSDFILLMADFPVKSVDIGHFTIHNMAGTFVQISITNTNTYEQQMQRAIRNVSVHDYTVTNDDSFWADADNSYVSLGVIECWQLNHYNGFQTGVKCKVNGNAIYDMYNDARVVHEDNITIVDCFGWNDHTMRPHKIKSAYQYSSQNKRWYYRRNYVASIKAIFPSVSEASSKGAFFFPETEDWHASPIGQLEYGNRFIHIDNCDIELIKLGTTNNSPVNNNIRITNNHFSSLDSGSVGFAYASIYPYNTYQQIALAGNRFDLPFATVTGLVRLSNGTGTGGGGFTGTVDISKNTGRFGSVLAFTDYNGGNVSGYANMLLSVSDNQFFATGNCRLTAPGQTPNMFDMAMCSGNYLKGSNINIGQLWNTNGTIEIGARAVGSSPIVVFETGVPTAMNVATGERYINIDNGASGTRVVKFTISKSGATTSIAFKDSTQASVSKTTGTNNGTFDMYVGDSAGFTLQCVVSSTGIIIQTGSSVVQRFMISGYSV